jgi:hypothetical protein
MLIGNLSDNFSKDLEIIYNRFIYMLLHFEKLEIRPEKRRENAEIWIVFNTDLKFEKIL